MIPGELGYTAFSYAYYDSAGFTSEGDGQMSNTEWAAYATANAVDTATFPFTSLDTDSDGSISYSEFSFAYYDASGFTTVGNGRLTSSEYAAYAAANGVTIPFSTADMDGDGFMTFNNFRFGVTCGDNAAQHACVVGSQLDGDCCAEVGAGTCSYGYVYTKGRTCAGNNVATCCVCPVNTYLKLGSCVPVPDPNMNSPQGSANASYAKCNQASALDCQHLLFRA